MNRFKKEGQVKGIRYNKFNLFCKFVKGFNGKFIFIEFYFILLKCFKYMFVL